MESLWHHHQPQWNPIESPNTSSFFLVQSCSSPFSYGSHGFSLIFCRQISPGRGFAEQSLRKAQERRTTRFWTRQEHLGRCRCWPMGMGTTGFLRDFTRQHKWRKWASKLDASEMDWAWLIIRFMDQTWSSNQHIFFGTVDSWSTCWFNHSEWSLHGQTWCFEQNWTNPNGFAWLYWVPKKTRLVDQHVSQMPSLRVQHRMIRHTRAVRGLLIKNSGLGVSFQQRWEFQKQSRND